MRKLSKIDESIWSDMQDRGSGDLIKKEDSYADTLKTPQAFFDYVKENYGPEHLIDTGLATLEMTLGANYGVTFKPANIKISFYWYDVKKMLFIFGTKDIIDDLSREYDLKPVGDHYKLTLENEELKNSIVLDVIDRMLESMSQNKYIETMIHKKDVNESIWSDMQDRGSGDSVKKEDEFNPEYIDFGPDTTVYWAQDALEIDDEIEFQFQDVENFNKNGWRLPTVEEVKQIDFQNCRRSWYRDDDGTPYNWLKLKNGTLRIKSENSLYGCHMWTKDRHERWKHDAYVYGYDNMSKFDIYPSSFSINKHFVFLVKDKPINESVWSDMQDRGTNTILKKEDEVNLLGLDKLCKYLNQIYGEFDHRESIKVNEWKGSRWLTIDLADTPSGYVLSISYDICPETDEKIIGISYELAKDWLDFNKFEKRYNSKVEKNEYDNDILTVYPKDGSEVTNEFLIDVIDYMLGEIPPGNDKYIYRKNNESIWSDMQDRGTGVIRKKEDELINQYDKRELFKYIQSNYEGNFRIINDTFRIVVPIVIDDSKFIMWLSIDYDQYRSIIQDILIYVDNNYEQMVTDLLKRCDNLYDVKKVEHSKNNFQNLITINDNSISKNSLCIDIIDICIDLVEKIPEISQARRLSKKMNESVWSDMQDRGNGDLVKKEDEVGNIGSLKPIDIGGSVLWADRDLEIDGEHLFKFEEVSNFIDANGWRLPTLEEVRELKEKCTFENEADHFTGNRKLVFKKRGMIYNTSVSHGNEYPTYLDEYWGWTSEPYINTSGSKPQNIHCFVITRSGNVVNLLVTSKNFNLFDGVTTDKSAKLCVRLVRSK